MGRIVTYFRINPFRIPIIYFPNVVGKTQTMADFVAHSMGVGSAGVNSAEGVITVVVTAGKYLDPSTCGVYKFNISRSMCCGLGKKWSFPAGILGEIVPRGDNVCDF